MSSEPTSTCKPPKDANDICLVLEVLLLPHYLEAMEIVEVKKNTRQVAWNWSRTHVNLDYRCRNEMEEQSSRMPTITGQCFKHVLVKLERDAVSNPSPFQLDRWLETIFRQEYPRRSGTKFRHSRDFHRYASASNHLRDRQSHVHKHVT